MNNSNTYKPHTDEIRNLPEDEEDFNYDTYPTVRVDTHKDKLVAQRSNEGEAYLSSAVGGSVSQLSFKDKASYQARSAKGGGIRGKIRGFSRISRRNLLRRLASINRSAFRAFKGRLLFLTLTYPANYPDDPEVCKKHLEAFGKRLERAYGALAIFWRMGIQKRGALHFHLLVFIHPSLGALKQVRPFIASSWYEICGELSEGHLLHGTHVEELRTWKKATSYAEKYMAKEEAFPEGLETGRIWGVWNEELLPVRWETVEVSLKDAFRIRRVYRRLAKRRSTGYLHRLIVFVQYENVGRLLEFLGYRQEE